MCGQCLCHELRRKSSNTFRRQQIKYQYYPRGKKPKERWFCVPAPWILGLVLKQSRVDTRCSLRLSLILWVSDLVKPQISLPDSRPIGWRDKQKIKLQIGKRFIVVTKFSCYVNNCICDTENEENSTIDSFCHQSDGSYPGFSRKYSLKAKSDTMSRKWRW